MFSSSSVEGDGVKRALTRPSARSASSRRSCRTATSGPFFTTRTPGTASAADVSASTSVAPCAGGRRILACSAPGGTMSPANFARPVTLSIASRRGADSSDDGERRDGFEGRLALELALDPPALGELAVGDVRGRVRAATRRQPRHAGRRPARAAAPRRAGAGRPSLRRPPRGGSGPNCRIESDPNVPMSHGQTSVSPMTMSTTSSGTSSSSATSCGSDVIVPCPSSTLPTNVVTRPSAPMWT